MSLRSLFKDVFDNYKSKISGASVNSEHRMFKALNNNIRCEIKKY